VRTFLDKIKLTIDGTEIEAEKGERLLWVALRNGFYIPNLCAVEGIEPPFGACRLCFVEIEGRGMPVTSCTVEVEEGMIVRTRSDAVDRLVRSAFELILSDHDLDCRNCIKNGSCELQQIAKARKLPLKPKRLKLLDRRRPIDSSHPCIIIDPNRCVLCGRCVHVCSHVDDGIGFDFAFRGMRTVITIYGRASADFSDCRRRLRCVEACPVGALIMRMGGLYDEDDRYHEHGRVD